MNSGTPATARENRLVRYSAPMMNADPREGERMSTQHDTTLLTLEEAAARLGVEPSTLEGWADEGRLFFVCEPDGTRRFTVQEIERWRKEIPFLAPSPWAEVLKRVARGEKIDSDSPLIKRLDATAKAIARGRVFEDSTEVIRAAREGLLDEYE